VAFNSLKEQAMGQAPKFIAFHAPRPMADRLYRMAAEHERTVSAELRLMLRQHLEDIESTRGQSSALKSRVEKEPGHAGT
jgi:hypothetical protein